MHQLSLFQSGYIALIKRIQQRIRQAKKKLKTFIDNTVKTAKGWSFQEIKWGWRVWKNKFQLKI